MRFSARLAATKGDRALVLEDAPRPTRIGYIKGVLADFVGTQGTSYGRKKEPLDAYDVHAAFIALIRDEADPWDYDNESTWSGLTAHLKDCNWPEFYDFIELAGGLLQKADGDSPFDESEHFKKYQAKVNALFLEDGIGWSLNDKAELHRQIPRSLAKRLTETESKLADRFANARVHYQKAVNYLYRKRGLKALLSGTDQMSRIA